MVVINFQNEIFLTFKVDKEVSSRWGEREEVLISL